MCRTSRGVGCGAASAAAPGLNGWNSSGAINASHSPAGTSCGHLLTQLHGAGRGRLLRTGLAYRQIHRQGTPARACGRPIPYLATDDSPCASDIATPQWSSIRSDVLRIGKGHSRETASTFLEQLLTGRGQARRGSRPST